MEYKDVQTIMKRSKTDPYGVLAVSGARFNPVKPSMASDLECHILKDYLDALETIDPLEANKTIDK